YSALTNVGWSPRLHQRWVESRSHQRGCDEVGGNLIGGESWARAGRTGRRNCRPCPLKGSPSELSSDVVRSSEVEDSQQDGEQHRQHRRSLGDLRAVSFEEDIFQRTHFRFRPHPTHVPRRTIAPLTPSPRQTESLLIPDCRAKPPVPASATSGTLPTCERCCAASVAVGLCRSQVPGPLHRQQRSTR